MEGANEYRIRPNYRTMRLGFSKLLGKLVVKYVPTYTKGTLKKKDQRRTYQMNDAYAIFKRFFFLFFFIKTYVVGTHLNCFDLYTRVSQ